MKISKEEKTKTLTTDKHKYDATNCDNFEAVFKGKSHESAMNLPWKSHETVWNHVLGLPWQCHEVCHEFASYLWKNVLEPCLDLPWKDMRVPWKWHGESAMKCHDSVKRTWNLYEIFFWGQINHVRFIALSSHFHIHAWPGHTLSTKVSWKNYSSDSVLVVGVDLSRFFRCRLYNMSDSCKFHGTFTQFSCRFLRLWFFVCSFDFFKQQPQSIQNCPSSLHVRFIADSYISRSC